jgi:hypothetical protein
MNRLHRLLLDPQGGEGGTGTPTPTPTDFDPQVAIREAVARHGDAERALGYFLRDNRKYRKDNGELKAKLPPEGAVVLAGDDARAWAEYTSLGKAGDLKAALAERDRFRDEAEGLRRAEVHKQAAEIHGYRASVLGDLVERKKLHVEVKDETVKGKPARVAYVRDEVDGKPLEMKLTDYAEKHWSEYLPSLRVAPARPSPGTPPRGDVSGAPPYLPEKPRPLYAEGNPFS